MDSVRHPAKLYGSAADEQDTELAGTWRGQMDAMLVFTYVVFSILPLVISSAPYQTALTTPLRPGAVSLRFRLQAAHMGGEWRWPYHFPFAPFMPPSFSVTGRVICSPTPNGERPTSIISLCNGLLEDVDEDSMDQSSTDFPLLSILHS
ncbi:hypothetical protein BC826DRAFT_1106820 [Russula brevipes]|nr:hypothetical protein BC826DRAFT_1106820 [Russula brevipes]